jgi:hypothetical protein
MSCTANPWGGAELKGELLDARQRVLTTVSSDARLAIDGFAGRLATACRNLAQNSTPG